VYLIHHAAVPRPRALLGDEHLRALLAQIALVRSRLPSADYRTLGLSAAGSGSPVLRRLTHVLAQHTGLAVAIDEGDCQYLHHDGMAEATAGTGVWEWPRSAAVYSVMIIPPIILFITLQRWFMIRNHRGCPAAVKPCAPRMCTLSSCARLVLLWLQQTCRTAA
jgi:hypothetical protein